MDTESFKVLEYGKITNWLASFASTICGKELCRSVIPSGDYDEVVRLHHETAEAVQVQQMQSPPFGGIYDLRTLLRDEYDVRDAECKILLSRSRIGCPASEGDGKTDRNSRHGGASSQ